LSQFIAAITPQLAAADIITDENQLTGFSTATYSTAHRPIALVYPRDIDQLQSCVSAANQHGIPLYTISTGLNTGYGSAAPTCDSCVVVCLKHMNRISNYRADLACVDIEPGVTQQQLYDFLLQQGDDLWLDATGSYPEHSLIGNLVERGFGHTHMADHFAHFGSLQVMLATGESFTTGFGQFPNSQAAGVYRWGVGACLEGLFSQSNLGIVTRATIWLSPKPAYTQSFAFSTSTEESLADLIERLRPLRLDGTIPSAMHIGNDYKVVTSILQHPAPGTTALSPGEVQALLAKWDFGAWNVSGALYGTRKEVAIARRRLKKAMRGSGAKMRFVDERLLTVAGGIAPLYKAVTGVNLEEMLRLARPVFGMTQGKPSRDVIASTYWRKSEPPPEHANPERDGCGLMWVAPVLPNTGADATKVWRLTRDTMLAHGFEPSVSITMISGRAADCVISIAYDRGVKGEDQRAKACHDALIENLSGSGYYPYRLGVGNTEVLQHRDPGYGRVLAGLKQQLDPNGILAPGRYEAP
jgi:4-cresol dehydrogenase (hydroxylating)